MAGGGGGGGGGAGGGGDGGWGGLFKERAANVFGSIRAPSLGFLTSKSVPHISWLQFELRPTKDIIPNAIAYLQNSVLTYQIEDLENRFDDLRNALTFAKKYHQSAQQPHDDIQRFISEINPLLRVFYSAISSLNKSDGQERLDDCLEAYTKALDGLDVEGKFVREWKQILSTKVSISCICLQVKFVQMNLPISCVLAKQKLAFKGDTSRTVHQEIFSYFFF